MNFFRFCFLTVFLLGLTSLGVANVKVASIFSSDMVLQRDKVVSVWGTADEGEQVTVTIGDQSVTAATSGGQWKVKLDPMPAGGPHELKIVGTNVILFTNVLVGDVWLCGGQSNMDFDIKSYTGWEGEIGSAYSEIVADSLSYENLRVVLMKKATSLPDETAIPVEDDEVFQGKWQTCSTEVVPRMSATGFVFAQRLQSHLKIPIGLIDANKGGSPVQTWYAPKSLELLEAKSSEVKNMYNAMIRPYRDFPIKGAIWYQGESNARSVESSSAYAEEFKAMIRGWRHDFQDSEMPFLFVQLAAYERNPFQHGVTYPVLRDSQTAALSLPKTGMAVAIDLGLPTNIHPPYKIPLSERLVLAARKVAYGEKLVHSGPVLKGLSIDGDRAVVSFNHVGGGLVVKEVTLADRTLSAESLEGFQISGADEVFHEADAVIEGDQVVVSSDQVSQPVAVRYAYRGFPYANLYNDGGLPASPFRTDDFEIVMNQESADLQNRTLFLPRSLSGTQMTIEQKRQVAEIHDQIITKEIEKGILVEKALYNEAARANGKGSPETKKALENYQSLLNPLLDQIGKAVKEAGIF
tara:strand:- start:297 stop:2033 length:1737 start_codon:yes stop_codon:yes gene_type:complete